MKIQNEYIKIKTDQEVVLHNYIYDNYLKVFSKTQYASDVTSCYKNQEKELSECYIKLETEIEDVTNATISDFDISITTSHKEVVGNRQSVKAFYTYTPRKRIYIIATGEMIKEIGQFAGKKITALAFGNGNIVSCVDTSKYNVFIKEGEELSVARKDIISSEAICTGAEYPIHLAPIFKPHKYQSAGMNCVADLYARLYSVGLGSTLGHMQEEYIIEKDIEAIPESETSFGFNLRKGDSPSIYPQNNLYGSDNLYPLPIYIINEIHPQTTQYCQEDLYPMASNYKYIIYKYQLYYIARGDSIETLDKYYTMSYASDAKGLFEIINKIERG